MLSSKKIEEIKNCSHKEFWKRLQWLNQATQRTKEEEEELTVFREEILSRKKQELLDQYNSDESVSYRNDLEELDQLMDEVEPKFDQLDKVRLKVNTGGVYGATIPAGSEGFVMDVLRPDFERYRKTRALVYRYEVKIEIWDLDTFKIIVHDRVTVDEDEVEGLEMLTIDKEFRARGGRLPIYSTQKRTDGNRQT